MSHTPGPWIASFAESGGYDCMTDAWHIEAGGRIIADVDLSAYGQSLRRVNSAVRFADAEADAKLIAAAPELLAALKLAMPCLMDAPVTPQSSAALELALAAIGKAEQHG